MIKFKNGDFDPIPISHNDISNVDLKFILLKKQKDIWLCWHHWVLWKFGKATRLHRICTNCYKKQVNDGIVKVTNIWRNSNH